MGYVYTDEKAQRLIRNYGSIISFCLLLGWFEIMILRPSRDIGIEMVCTVKFTAAAGQSVFVFVDDECSLFFRMKNYNLNDTYLYPYLSYRLIFYIFFSFIPFAMVVLSVTFILLLSANNITFLLCNSNIWIHQRLLVCHSLWYRCQYFLCYQ
jgi:hypothetical protein